MRIKLLEKQVEYVKVLIKLSDDDFLDIHYHTSRIFVNRASFRLTDHGFSLSKKNEVKFIGIDFDRTSTMFTSRHILALSRQEKPFYYNKKTLFLQDEEEAAMFLLMNGNLDLYANMKKDNYDT